MANLSEADNIGWSPVSERSIIASRLKPKATPADGAVHAPLRSGPRWCSVAAILVAAAKRSCSLWVCEQSTTPAIPHIYAEPRRGHDDKTCRERSSRGQP